MDQGSSRRVLAGILISLPLAACHRFEFKTVASQGVSCEVPREWEYSPGGGSILWFVGPEAVREVGMFISIHEDTPRERPELEEFAQYNKQIFREDANFSIEPMVEVTVGGSRGYMISMTRTQLAEHMHGKKPLPPPVKFRESEIFLKLDRKGYTISYGAPSELYDKYRAAFERVLATLKVER